MMLYLGVRGDDQAPAREITCKPQAQIEILPSESEPFIEARARAAPSCGTTCSLRPVNRHPAGRALRPIPTVA